MALFRCLPRLGWGKGAIHPNTSNFRRALRFDVVARVRRLCEWGLLKDRPKWLEWAERVPPMENHSLSLQVRKIRNPYPQMVNFLLKKYPDLRFQDCYVDGNDWSAGNDTFRDDHPVMQFVARQLDFMNQGISKKEAFRKTEDLFRERREYLEKEQKVMMAMALNSGLAPMFSTGRAYLEAETAKSEAAHLKGIHRQLRQLKLAEAERQADEQHRKQKAAAAADGGADEKAKKVQRKNIAELRFGEQSRLKENERQRLNLVGDVTSGLDPWGLGLSDQAGTVNPASSPAEEVDSTDEVPVDGDALDAEAINRLTSDERQKAVMEGEEQASPTMQASAPEESPDVKRSRYFDRDEAPLARAPEVVVTKPEDNLQVTTTLRRQPRGEKGRKSISAKGLGNMLSGGVQGEDMLDDVNSDVAARRRQRSGVYDDNVDDADDFLPGRGRGGRGGR